jgi:hypothetical protein
MKMKVKPLMVAVGAAVTLLIAHTGTASANVMWCAGDPPVHVITANGAHLTVNNYLYVSGPRDGQLASEATFDSSVVGDGHGGSLITVIVHVPNGLDVLAVTSIEHRLNVQTNGSGPGGTVITLTLDVPIS